MTVLLNRREKGQREVTQLFSGGVGVWREGNGNSLQYSHLGKPMNNQGFEPYPLSLQSLHSFHYPIHPLRERG